MWGSKQQMTDLLFIASCNADSMFLLIFFLLEK